MPEVAHLLLDDERVPERNGIAMLLRHLAMERDLGLEFALQPAPAQEFQQRAVHGGLDYG